MQEATVQKASKYTKWTDENRYAVRKYASKHGNAVRHFKKDFPNIKETTVREFKKKYEKQLLEVKKQNLQPLKSIESTPQRQDDLCFWKNSICWFKTLSKGQAIVVLSLSGLLLLLPPKLL